MSIALACSGCRTRLKVEERTAGGNVRCPRCRMVTAIPATPAPTPPDDGFRILEESPPIAPRRKRKLLFAVAALSLALVGGGAFVLRRILRSNPLPDLMDELPPGTCAMWERREALEMEFGGSSPRLTNPTYAGMRELAGVIRFDGKSPGGMVIVMKGDFDVAAVEERYGRRGYQKKNIDGYEILVEKGRRSSDTDDAAAVNRTRIVEGPQGMVIEALKVRSGWRDSFSDSLTSRERAAARKLPRGQAFVMYHDMPGLLPGAVRLEGCDLGAPDPTADAGTVMTSTVKTGEHQVTTFTIALCDNEDQASRLETQLRKGLGPHRTVLSQSRSGVEVRFDAKVDLNPAGKFTSIQSVQDEDRLLDEIIERISAHDAAVREGAIAKIHLVLKDRLSFVRSRIVPDGEPHGVNYWDLALKVIEKIETEARSGVDSRISRITPKQPCPDRPRECGTSLAFDKLDLREAMGSPAIRKLAETVIRGEIHRAQESHDQEAERHLSTMLGRVAE